MVFTIPFPGIIKYSLNAGWIVAKRYARSIKSARSPHILIYIQRDIVSYHLS
ncbi:hypothetical protein UUU_17090 [Klebsiella pneumoniae subsp. pneumoniae DSM 30104 = JCM 1662 = NBRC 14940]|nr:hypothetical protein KP13_04378 [Klebsiella pneumoniae subsp. pneumoniae Kp13]EJK91349.1 hypothetical protein UUU_17090 [Klebsiella pneumoniae subsp. pneumoniae DSM 30104 = JCM 1662 = NBRC 14940]